MSDSSVRSSPRVYLDHAATSWPKSAAVLEAMDRFARTGGAAAGRGGYQSAAESDQIVAIVRRGIATLIGAADANTISLHSNGTAALNAAIQGVVRPGDHVVTSAAEHNSVLRPLHHLQRNHDVSLSIIPVNAEGSADAVQLLDAVTPRTRLVALTHASNVTGELQPIDVVGTELRNRDTLFLVDAAQTFGTLEVNVGTSGIDLLAAPGHKSSGGPLGTAFLYVDESVHSEIEPSVQGGTGSQSESLEMPTTMPSMLEAGNLNVHALAGWAAALNELSSGGVDQREQFARSMANRLHAGLAEIPHLRLFGQPGRLPIASIAIKDLSPTDAAVILDAEFGIETRAGLHCAALIHGYLGSASEGTLRLSAGHTTTEAEIDAAIEAIGNVVRTLHPH